MSIRCSFYIKRLLKWVCFDERNMLRHNTIKTSNKRIYYCNDMTSKIQLIYSVRDGGDLKQLPHTYVYFIYHLIGTRFVYCVVPQTKGKNAEEIRMLFFSSEMSFISPEQLDPNNNQESVKSNKTAHTIPSVSTNK